MNLNIPDSWVKFKQFVMNNYKEILKHDEERFHKLFNKNVFSKSFNKKALSKTEAFLQDMWYVEDEVFIMIDVRSLTFGSFITVKITTDDMEVFNHDDVSIDMFDCIQLTSGVFNLKLKNIGEVVLHTI